MRSRELSVRVKLRVCARAVLCGRWFVHVCARACETETVHVKFSEDCVYVRVSWRKMGGHIQ